MTQTEASAVTTAILRRLDQLSQSQAAQHAEVTTRLVRVEDNQTRMCARLYELEMQDARIEGESRGEASVKKQIQQTVAASTAVIVAVIGAVALLLDQVAK